MKIQCPNCGKITELEHVDHGSQVECLCSHVFTVEESTVVEEFTEIDSSLPERIGQYPVTGFIGFGGMGKVYLGQHPNLGIPVAIKVLRMEYMTDQASCDRFIQSAKICARINHPNIVRIYDCGYENNNVYLVMEYISNGSAQTLLEQEGKLDPEHAAFIMLEVCSGLMEAEKYGIVHRDIKPENIMFDQEGTVKILDLGLSKIIGDRRISQQNITASLTSLGTPLYMAPEQAVDASNCDSRADIYSIGVSLYQFCTGKLPFDAEDPHELRRLHALEKPIPPRQLEPSLRPDMETIILRCMEKKREDRYASITDLALDLEAYLKNRILPSAIRQKESAVSRSKARHRRHVLRQWIEFRRKTAPLLSRRSLLYAAAGITGILVLTGICCWQVMNPTIPVRKSQNRLSAEKILSELSRQAAFYAENQDFEKIILLYTKYHGPLEKETRLKRQQIADGYRLTWRQTANSLRLELARLVLRSKYAEAWTRFLSENGRILCPEYGNFLRELAEIPTLFQLYWKQRRGQNVTLNLNGQGKIRMRIVEVRTSGIYAAAENSEKLIHFSINELPLADQLRIIQRVSPNTRELWIRLSLWRSNPQEATVRRLKNMPVFKPEFTSLLAGETFISASGKDSDRNQ